MSEVVQPRVRHDRGHVARLGPEPVESPIGQRFVPDLAREHPFPGSLVGEIIQQRPRRFAALLHESELAHTDPDPQFFHRPMRYDIGLPSPVI